MDQRISLITLAVDDAAETAAFYDAMGWIRVDNKDGVIAYDLLGQTLGLYPKDMLAKDIGVPPETLGHGGMTLGYNVRGKGEVAEVLNAARAAGGRILKEAADVFWGGHHGYFSDPEGNIWEVAYNPFSALSSEGAFRWNGYS